MRRTLDAIEPGLQVSAEVYDPGIFEDIAICRRIEMPGVEERSTADRCVLIPPEIQLAPLPPEYRVQTVLIPQDHVATVLAEIGNHLFGDPVFTPAIEIEDHDTGVEILLVSVESERRRHDRREHVL